MARKDDSKSSGRPVITPRFAWRVLIAAVMLVATLYCWHKTEQFLIRDARFALALPDYGIESPSLQISGERYVSHAQILRIFSADYGRSLYLLPIKERRRELLAIDWIRDASVARLWPNRVVVQIEEREPVAFLNVPGESRTARVSLIDSEGVFLQPPGKARFTLPVAVGISPDEAQYDRRTRVHRLMALMKDIGPLGDRISEVDVSDTENLKVTARAERRSIALILGDHDFGRRLRNFFNNYSKIQERLVEATAVDLRLEDRITVVEGGKQ